jgi:hypothetical protein
MDKYNNEIGIGIGSAIANSSKDTSHLDDEIIYTRCFDALNYGMLQVLDSKYQPMDGEFCLPTFGIGLMDQS